MQEQREGSSQKATLWSGVHGGADGYAKKRRKGQYGVATALKKLEKVSQQCPKALCVEKP